MKEELYKLFVQKRAIRRKINTKWFYYSACIIYNNKHPHQLIQVKGKLMSYIRFAFSYS
jgi:hypothetical protein